MIQKQSAILLAFLVLPAAIALAEARPPDRFAWQILAAGDVRPTGWLREEWADDFAHGLPGHLDEINLDVAQQVFAAQDRGLQAGGRPSWWPGEQGAYWHEAYIHAAFQLGDEAAIRRATDYVEAILRSQAADGYLGVYAADARLLPVSDPRYGEAGGELHTQAHLFLALLAFYEYTGRTDVLRAVERAARLSMRVYRGGVFGTAGSRTSKAGGNSHAVDFIDPMIQLYRLTGDESYLEFVATIYDSYNEHPPRDHDLSRAVLDDPAALFVGHGAHTAESLHFPFAVALLGDAAMRRRADAALEKLQRQLTPGGALVCDEMIGGRVGNGHELYEYCAQSELLKSLAWIVQDSGSGVAAERAARLFFNSLQGSRLHPLSALQYLSCDDRLDIPTSSKKDASNITDDGSHFQMSSIIRPTCCPASSGRPLPYFLSSTWMKRPDGSALALMNFAPSTVATALAGGPVRIVEETAYPFGDRVALTLALKSAVTFDLVIRLPEEGDIELAAAAGARESRRDGFLILSKNWRDNDRIELKLDLPVVLARTEDGSAEYYRRGSLTFALPFRSKVTKVSENPRWSDHRPSGYYEYNVTVADRSAWGYRIDPKARFVPVALEGDPLHPWESPPLGLRGTMIDAHGFPVAVTLVPLGASVSRRVTFLDASHSSEEAAQIPRPGHVALGL